MPLYFLFNCASACIRLFTTSAGVAVTHEIDPVEEGSKIKRGAQNEQIQDTLESFKTLDQKLLKLMFEKLFKKTWTLFNNPTKVTRQLIVNSWFNKREKKVYNKLVLLSFSLHLWRHRDSN